MGNTHSYLGRPLIKVERLQLEVRLPSIGLFKFIRSIMLPLKRTSSFHILKDLKLGGNRVGSVSPLSTDLTKFNLNSCRSEALMAWPARCCRKGCT
jgi:hypothetical protein